MDTTSEEAIYQELSSKNRNMIRKAIKMGVTIHSSMSSDLIPEFMKIYNSVMDFDRADSYYYFDEGFYESIVKNLSDNALFFYAEYQNKIIAMSIILFANEKVHYHLSGSLHEYRNLEPTNLLLYQVALWACRNGYKSFHLGGGVGGSREDDLFKFKKSFNRNSDNEYCVGKFIIDDKRYRELIDERANETGFDKDSKFFPLYRVE